MKRLNNKFYKDIFKRKSFHLFRNVGPDLVEKKEFENIKAAFDSFERLYPEIKTTIRILPASDVNFKRGAEYCILIYSEKKGNYLMNAGFIGEQLDLYLVHHNIGTLWFGIGKPDVPTYEGLDYIIMIALHKANDLSMYRKNVFKEDKRGIMPMDLVAYYNRIDIGIFLCILEICLCEEKIEFERKLFLDSGDDEYSKVAEYYLHKEVE